MKSLDEGKTLLKKRMFAPSEIADQYPLFQNVTGRALRRLVCSSTSSGCSCNPSGGIQSTGTWRTFHTTRRVWQTSDPNTQTSKRLVSHYHTIKTNFGKTLYQFSRPLVPSEGCDGACKSERIHTCKLFFLLKVLCCRVFEKFWRNFFKKPLKENKKYPLPIWRIHFLKIYISNINRLWH